MIFVTYFEFVECPIAYVELLHIIFLFWKMMDALKVDFNSCKWHTFHNIWTCCQSLDTMLMAWSTSHWDTSWDDNWSNN